MKNDSFHRNKSLNLLAESMPTESLRCDMKQTLHKLANSCTMVESNRNVAKLYELLKAVTLQNPKLAAKAIKCVAWHARRSKHIFGTQYMVGLTEHSMCESNHHMMSNMWEMKAMRLPRGVRHLILMGLDCESWLCSAAKFGTVRNSLTVALQRKRKAGGMPFNHAQEYATELVVERGGGNMIDKPLVNLFTHFGEGGVQPPTVDCDDNHSFNPALQSSEAQENMQSYMHRAVHDSQMQVGKLTNAQSQQATDWPPRDFKLNDRMLPAGTKVVRVQEPSSKDKSVTKTLRELKTKQLIPDILEDSGPFEATHQELVSSLRQKLRLVRKLLLREHNGRLQWVVLGMWPSCECMSKALGICLHLRFVYEALLRKQVDVLTPAGKWAVQQQLTSKEAREVLKAPMTDGVQTTGSSACPLQSPRAPGLGAGASGGSGKSQSASHNEHTTTNGPPCSNTMGSGTTRPGPIGNGSGWGDGNTTEGNNGNNHNMLAPGAEVYHQGGPAGAWDKGMVDRVDDNGQVLVAPIGVGGGRQGGVAGVMVAWVQVVVVQVHHGPKRQVGDWERGEYSRIVKTELPGLWGGGCKWEEMLYDPTGAQVSLTLNAGAVVVGGFTFKRWCWPPNGELLQVNALAVHQAHTRCGYGRLMFELARAVVASEVGLGREGWVVTMAEETTTALGFWKGVGMTEFDQGGTLWGDMNSTTGAAATFAHAVAMGVCVAGGVAKLRVSGLPPPPAGVGCTQPLRQGTRVEAWLVGEQAWVNAEVMQQPINGKVLVKRTTSLSRQLKQLVTSKTERLPTSFVRLSESAAALGTSGGGGDAPPSTKSGNSGNESSDGCAGREGGLEGTRRLPPHDHGGGNDGDTMQPNLGQPISYNNPHHWPATSASVLVVGQSSRLCGETTEEQPAVLLGVGKGLHHKLRCSDFGGAMEHGEEPHICAFRELAEELLGLDGPQAATVATDLWEASRQHLLGGAPVTHPQRNSTHLVYIVPAEALSRVVTQHFPTRVASPHPHSALETLLHAFRVNSQQREVLAVCLANMQSLLDVLGTPQHEINVRTYPVLWGKSLLGNEITGNTPTWYSAEVAVRLEECYQQQKKPSYGCRSQGGQRVELMFDLGTMQEKRLITKKPAVWQPNSNLHRVANLPLRACMVKCLASCAGVLTRHAALEGTRAGLVEGTTGATNLTGSNLSPTPSQQIHVATKAPATTTTRPREPQPQLLQGWSAQEMMVVELAKVEVVMQQLGGLTSMEERQRCWENHTTHTFMMRLELAHAFVQLVKEHSSVDTLFSRLKGMLVSSIRQKIDGMSGPDSEAGPAQARSPAWMRLVPSEGQGHPTTQELVQKNWQPPCHWSRGAWSEDGVLGVAWRCKQMGLLGIVVTRWQPQLNVGLAEALSKSVMGHGIDRATTCEDDVVASLLHAQVGLDNLAAAKELLQSMIVACGNQPTSTGAHQQAWLLEGVRLSKRKLVMHEALSTPYERHVNFRASVASVELAPTGAGPQGPAKDRMVDALRAGLNALWQAGATVVLVPDMGTSTHQCLDAVLKEEVGVGQCRGGVFDLVYVVHEAPLPSATMQARGATTSAGRQQPRAQGLTSPEQEYAGMEPDWMVARLKKTFKHLDTEKAKSLLVATNWSWPQAMVAAEGDQLDILSTGVGIDLLATVETLKQCKWSGRDHVGKGWHLCTHLCASAGEVADIFATVGGLANEGRTPEWVGQMLTSTFDVAKQGNAKEDSVALCKVTGE